MPVPLNHLAAHVDPGFECLGQGHVPQTSAGPPPERLVQFGGVDAVQPDQLPRHDDGSPSMTCKDPYMLREELKHEIEYGVGEGNPGVAAPSTPAAEWQKADTARSLGYGRLLANYLTFDDRSPRNPFGMGSVLSSSQPLTLTEVELDKALDILGAALQEVECNYSGPDC